MKTWLAFVLAGLFLQALAMPTRAATTALTSIPSAGDCAIGPLTSSIAAVALGANAGSVDFVATYPCRPIPATDAGPFIWTVNIDGPQLLAGGLAGTSVAIAKTYTGCAVSGADSAVSDFALTTDHYALASAFTFNSGSSVCSIYLAVTVTIATTANTHFRVILTIARETNYRLEYICDHSATTPLAFVPNSNSCGTLNENNAITGSLTLSGSLGVVNSGTLHLVVDSWPSLTAAVTNSGTLNVVNSGDQNMTVSGSLTVAGGLTVTNAGGQSLTVTSWPQLQAVLSGTVNTIQSGSLAISQNGTWQVDNLMRLCAASTFGSNCTTPTINLAGALNATIGGTLDILDRLCAASTTGSTCSQATISAIVSGTLDNLNRICAASATGTGCTTASLNTVVSGVLSVTVNGTIDNLNRLCGASATGTSCTVPSILATLNGTLDILDRLCASSATGSPCTTPTINGLNVTTNVSAAQVNVTAPVNVTLNPTVNSTINATFNGSINGTLNGTLNGTGGGGGTATPSGFELSTGVKGSEFFVLIFVVLTAIVIWSRSQDFLVQFSMGVLCLIVAVVWLGLIIVGTWRGLIPLTMFSAGMGGYMMIRTSLDKIAENKVKRKGLPA